jgi:hypothetical protein
MRASALVALSFLAGCDVLWGTYTQPNPQNCATGGLVCGNGTMCNLNTGTCQTPDEASSPPVPLPAACDPGGFCWENPLPQGNDINRAWARAANDIWFAGANGSILHWDGIVLSRAVTPTTFGLNGVWALGANEAWAVGDSGTVLHWDGSTWNLVATTGARLRGVYGTSASSVYMVGDNGTLRQWDGSTLRTLKSGATYSLESIWGTSASDMWAVGTAGTIVNIQCDA